MADMSALGILSLLLLGGGAAYLVWTRRRLGGQTAAVLPAPRRPDRTSETIPPTLRPEADMPAKMAAKKEAHARTSGKPPASEQRKEASAPPEAKKPSGAPAKSKSGPPAAQAKASETEAPARPQAKASETEAPARPQAKASEPEATARKASNPPAAKATPSSAASAVEAPAKKASNPPSAKTTAPATKAAKRDAPKKERAALPRVDSEDDDVELTKVGKGPAQEKAAIRPLVEKVVFDEGADSPPEANAADTALVYAVGQTDTGKRRKENQDAFLIFDKESLFVVADGMGGHKGGQVASKLCVDTMEQAFARKYFEAAAHENIAIEASELARAVQMANTAIFTAAKGNSELEGMGTTVVAARFTADRQRLYIAHVGDSRCYRVRDGAMKQMTSDHTMADYGVTGPEGAHLSRAVGVWPTVPIDVVMAKPQVGDLYLICSDGLTKMVAEGTIATQLLHEDDPKSAVRRLILFANSHGGKDNSTVVLLRVVPPGWKPPRQSSLPPPAG